jgi:hypothetical protein
MLLFILLPIVFHYFGQYSEILWEKISYSLALHLVENNEDLDLAPDPDRQALDADAYTDPFPPK